MYGWTRTAMIPFYIQVTQLIKHLSVGRQHALSENVGGLLRKQNGDEYDSGKCNVVANEP